ncbi:family 20 glycosylhydrolase [Kribbella sp. NPDC003505]
MSVPTQHDTDLRDLVSLHKINRPHLHLSDDQGWRI